MRVAGNYGCRIGGIDGPSSVALASKVVMSGSTHRTGLTRGLRRVRDDWLNHCEGFVVDSPDGRIGVVDHLRFGSRPGYPEALAVTAGLFARRLLIISTRGVEEVNPARRRVVLGTAPELLGTEPLPTRG